MNTKLMWLLIHALLLSAPSADAQQPAKVSGFISDFDPFDWRSGSW